MGRVFFPTFSLNRFGVRDTNQRAMLGAVPRFDSEPNVRAANNPTPNILGAVPIMPISDMIRVPFSWTNPTGGPITGPISNPVGWRGPIVARPAPSPIVAPPQPPATPINASPGSITIPTNPVPYPIIVGPPIAYQPPAAAQPLQPTPAPLPPTVGPISSSGGGGSVISPWVPPSVPPGVAPPVSTQVNPTPVVSTTPPASTGTVLVSSGGGTQVPATSPIIVSPSAPATGVWDQITAWLSGNTMLMNYNVPNALIAGVVVLGAAWLSSGSGKKR